MAKNKNNKAQKNQYNAEFAEENNAAGKQAAANNSAQQKAEK